MVMQCWEALLFCMDPMCTLCCCAGGPDSTSFCSSVWLSWDCCCLHSYLALPLVWNATCPDTFAPSHLQLAATEAGAVAAQAEWRKRVKYTELDTSHHFIPVAMETTDVFRPETLGFFQDLGRRIREESGSHNPTITQFNESQLQCKEGTQPPWWAPPSPEHLIPTLTMYNNNHAWNLSTHRCAHHSFLFYIIWPVCLIDFCFVSFSTY